MAELFQCSWETGTNLINSSPTPPEDAFASVNNEGGGDWEKKTDSAGWNGQANYALCSVANSGRYCQFTGAVGGVATHGARMAFRVNTLSDAATKKVIMRTLDATGANANMVICLHNDGGTPKIIAKYVDSDPATVEFGSVTIATATWYQIEYKVTANTLNGAAFKVWSEDGNTQIGTTQTAPATTINTNPRYLQMGGVDYAAGSFSGLFDIVYVDDADFPGPEIVAASGGTAVAVSTAVSKTNIGLNISI